MKNLLDEIKSIEKGLTYKKEKIKDVVNKIKAEMSECYFSKNDETDFRFAFMLMIGDYCSRYSLGSMLPNNYDLIRSTFYKNHKYEGYYDISKRNYYNNFDYESKNVGFVCYGNDILKAIEPYLESMWKYVVNENNYKDSFHTYNELLKSFNFTQIFAIFETYIDSLNKNYLLTEINYKNFGIKNVVIFIKDKN